MQEELRVLIVDDEPKAREVVRHLLGKHCPEVDIVGEAGSVAEGLTAVSDLKPDLLLLDVQMQDGTGFDLLQKLDNVPFKVIFITAFQEFAIEAFRFSAIDYLLKPLMPDELAAAIRKASKTLEVENMNLQVSALLSNLKNIPKEDKKIVLKTSESIHLISSPEVVRCQSDGNYTIFFLKDGRKLMVSRLIKDYEQMLEPQGFFRCHQSHLINLDYFQEFVKKDALITMRDGSMIPVSVRKKEILMQILSDL